MATTKEKKYTEAVGKRKTSVARVRISAATRGGVKVNDKDLADYFVAEELRTIIARAMAHLENPAKFDITVQVKGGGMHSQAEALAHGIARVLVLINPELRAPIKKAGMLARDARIKERRKFGLKKARKSPQWSKR